MELTMYQALFTSFLATSTIFLGILSVAYLISCWVNISSGDRYSVRWGVLNFVTSFLLCAGSIFMGITTFS